MPKSIRWILFGIVYAGLAILLAFGLFNFTRGFTACWRITSLPGLPPQSCSSQRVDALQTPVIVDGYGNCHPNIHT